MNAQYHPQNNDIKQDSACRCQDVPEGSGWLSWLSVVVKLEKGFSYEGPVSRLLMYTPRHATLFATPRRIAETPCTPVFA